MMNDFHKPVLLQESIDGLSVKSSGVYVDATFGGGGHSKKIFSRLQDGQLVAFDQDKAALKNQIEGNSRFSMVNKNFKYLKRELALLGISSIDGLIADLGVSSYQFTDNKRGFSLKYDAVIDMRMDDDLKKDGVFVLNHYSHKNLSRIFREYADFKNPNVIVDAIVESRSKKLIKTTYEFKNIINNALSYQNENKFFARLFQAVRIEVNDEIGALKDLLEQCLEILKPSGRIAIISYHSVEDRVVKSFMKFGNFSNSPYKDFFGNAEKPFRVVTKKPITPSMSEIKSNNKSRSAKLRICEKI